ncbi:MAG: tRNA pseudouridine(13) synthase TruD, partial [Pseudomonadota bacterium]
MSGESPEATWPRAAPPPLRAGTIRARPEDFAVEEMLPFVLSGTGEHQWLQLRKRATNTEFLARQIARVAKVPVRDVGYAGLKDRHAVATQWFSVRLPGRDVTEWAAQLAEHAEVLQATRHVRKLDRGALSGNRFTIVVRDCAADGQMPLSQGIQKIAHIGVPNYFGEQRFGRDADNVARAQAMFAAQEVVRSRHQRGIYLSAARAFLFNTVLARRVTDGSWNALLEGEAVMLAGSRSFFVAETIDDVLRERLDRADVHPSGPLWGRGE